MAEVQYVVSGTGPYRVADASTGEIIFESADRGAAGHFAIQRNMGIAQPQTQAEVWLDALLTEMVLRYPPGAWRIDNGEVSAPDGHLIARCKDWKDALQLCRRALALMERLPV